MKNSKLRKIITKVMGALLLSCALVGIITVSFPTSVAYAAEGTAVFEEGTDFAWGDSVLTDPAKVETENGAYYVPTAYIYCGTYFDEDTLKFVPVLCRVLDADADNAGNADAMFLLTENGINAGEYLFEQGVSDISKIVDWDNVYTESFLHLYATNNFGFPIFSSAKTSEKAYMRPITKTDVKANMEGLFGYRYEVTEFYFETDYVDDYSVHPLGRWAVAGDSATYLQNTPFFLLSVEEIYNYLGTYNGAPSFGTTNLKGEDAIWLTRTGLGESYVDHDNEGNYVAGVDANGNIIPVSVDDATAYTRIAFNLEKGNIVYTQMLDDNVYRIAFTHPEYDAAKKGESLVPFGVRVTNTDTETNKVTLEYQNTYRLPSADIMQSYISVIIEDGEGNIKYYGNIKALDGGYEYLDTAKGTAEFTLPDGYDRDTDKIYVFWENKPIDNKGISYVSNMVELGCLHTAYDKITDTHGSYPNCISAGKCAICSEDFGDIIPDAHTVDTSVYHCDLEDGVELHWNVCTVCDKKINVKSCSFSPSALAPCLLECDLCDTSKEDRSKCQYDENGICKYNPEHLESPAYIPQSGYVEVVIENEGQWMSLANTINNGEIIRDADGKTVYIGGGTVEIYITSDLNFKGIDGFVPMGTEENSAKGYISCRGGEFTIKGIRYQSEDANVGLFGVAERMRIRNITLTDCQFSGSSNVGALVGKAYDVSVSESRVIGDVIVCAEDGTEGAYFGTAVSGEFINTSKITFASVAYGVTNDSGKDLPFVSESTPDEAIMIQDSFCLTEFDGERGCTSAETFASGLVANKLQYIVPGWTQIIDKIEANENTGEDVALTPEAFPRYIPKDESGKRAEKIYRVYMIAYCDGSPSRLTNNARSNYTVHKPAEVLEWTWDEIYNCDARVKCELCGEEIVVEANVELDYTYVPVRGDYTATLLDPNGIPYTDADGKEFSDSITVIGIHIQDMIGMTYIDKVYDGIPVDPEGDMLNNHRLNTGDPYPAAREYEVYFVDENGEQIVELGYDYYGKPYYYPISVSDVGVYDLVVVGKNDYTDQTYVYEDALIIRPAVVEIEPEDVYKYYDGKTTFTPEYKIVDTEMAKYYSGGFTITYGEAESNKEGVYSVSVSVTNEMGDDNVQFVLTRETVQAVILPALFVEVENKDYPTQFVYGDEFLAPVPDNFKFTEGSELTFEWYVADVDRWLFEVDGKFVDQYEVLSMRMIDGVPKNAGDYVLRVKAGGVGNLAASYCDVVIRIAPRESLGITLNLDEIETYSDGYNTYYVIEPGQFPNGFEYTVSGLVEGDTLESAGIGVYVQGMPATGGGYAFEGFPQRPSNRNYYVSYRLTCDPGDGTLGNYNTDDATAGVYVMVKSRAGAKPVSEKYLADGTEKEIGVVLSWQGVEGASHYTLNVTDPDGNPTEIIRAVGTTAAYDIVHGNIFADYTLTKAGEYLVTVFADDVETESYTFEVVITNEGGEMLDSIVDMGRYTVTVKYGGNEYSAEMLVQREIVMLVKEMEYNLFGGELSFDRTNVVMEAGKVILIGHKLVDVKLAINYNSGQVAVESFRVVLESDESVDVTYLYSLNNSVYSWSHSNENGRNVVHIFDSACDSDCNISGCEYVRVAVHTGGEATCISQAICESCHSPYGEVNKDAHVGEKTHIAPNGEDLETHLRIYSCCGQTAEVLDHTEGVAATCISRAVCADCGWEYGELDPDNHASETLTYETVGEAGHKAIRTCCQSFETEEHTGGTATCIALAKCEHCEAEYGRYDADNHSGHIEYTPDPDNAGSHIEEYGCCKTSAVVAHSGGVETCVSRATCAYCNAEYGAIDPHNHATENLVYTVRGDNASMHDITRECCGAFVGKEYHSGGEGTCITAAVCDLCNTEYGSSTDKDNHASEELVYKQDPMAEGIHIVAYACCGKEISREAHFGGEATCTAGALCEHCGAEYGELIAHEFDNACDSICNICEKQVRPLVFHEDENGDNKCDECDAVIDEELERMVEATREAERKAGNNIVTVAKKGTSIPQLLSNTRRVKSADVLAEGGNATNNEVFGFVILGMSAVLAIGIALVWLLSNERGIGVFKRTKR